MLIKLVDVAVLDKSGAKTDTGNAKHKFGSGRGSQGERSASGGSLLGTPPFDPVNQKRP